MHALTAYNSQLEAIDFDYGDMAKLTPAIIEEAGKKFDHIEINYSKGSLAVRITVYDNHVFLTVPYWYQDQKSQRLFKDIKAYINIISETTGYYIYDPQTGQVYGPKEFEFDGLNKYLSVSTNRGND